MGELVSWLTDFYAKNKELAIALVGVLVGAIISWILNKLGPWIWGLLRWFFDLIGKTIGGRFAYASIRRRYLNWVVLQTQDLNLTGIIATGEKPKLEQVFVSLKMLDNKKENDPNELKTDKKETGYGRVLKVLGLRRDTLSKTDKINAQHQNKEEDLFSIFRPRSNWKVRQFMDREGVKIFFGWALTIIFLVMLPIYGWFLSPNINNWAAGISVVIFGTLFALTISVLIDDISDKGSWIAVGIGGVILASLIFIVKVRVFDDHQSPLALTVGTVIAVPIMMFFVYFSSTKSSDRNLNAKEIGELLRSSDNLAILGKPGSGKSTYVQFIALTFAQEKAGQPKLRKQGVVKGRFGFSKWYLPILIPLRKIGQYKEKGNDAGMLLEAFRQTVLPSEVRDVLTNTFLRYMLTRKQCLFLLDGLDEVADDAEFQLIAKEILGLVSQYPGNKFVVTSRYSGWRGGVGSNFVQTEINDLDSIQIRSFIRNWYQAIEYNRQLTLPKNQTKETARFRVNKASEKASALIRVLEETESIRNLARNPLLLSMICYVHFSKQLPHERLSLYEDCNKLLLEQWDIEKGYPKEDIPLKLMQKDLIMQEIAFNLHSGKLGNEKEAKSSEIIPIIGRTIKRFGMDVEQAEILFQKLINRTGVIVVAEKYKDLYSFSHLTFQEFYTAKYLVSNGIDIFQAIEDADSENLRSLSGWWREVVLLYSGMVRDASTIISELCNKQSMDILKRELQIAAQCLTESLEAPQPEVERELLSIIFSIRTTGMGEQRIDSFDSEIKDYLIRFARGEKIFRHALRYYIQESSLLQGVEIVEASLKQSLLSVDRSIKNAAGEAYVELWMANSQSINPDPDTLGRILESAELSTILSILRIFNSLPSHSVGHETIETIVKAVFEKVINDSDLIESSVRSTRFLLRPKTLSEVFALNQIIHQLNSELFQSQKQNIQLQFSKILKTQLHPTSGQDWMFWVLDLLFQSLYLSDDKPYFFFNKLLLQGLVQNNDIDLLLRLKKQLLEMSIKGDVKNQIMAIYLLAELYSEDNEVFSILITKIKSPSSKVRGAAVAAFRHVTIGKDQIVELKNILNDAISPKTWGKKIVGFWSALLFGKGELGIQSYERLQIIGTLCFLMETLDEFVPFDIKKELDVESKPFRRRDEETKLIELREDLLGRNGEKVIVEQLSMDSEKLSLWNKSVSPLLLQKMLNLLTESTPFIEDAVMKLMNDSSFHIWYHSTNDGNMITLSQLLHRIFKHDSQKLFLLARKQIKSEDIQIADCAFDLLIPEFIKK